MTLLFVDGFDHYQTADITKKYEYTDGSVTVETAGGRRNGGCLKLAYNCAFGKTFNPVDTLILGFAYKFSNTNANVFLHLFNDSFNGWQTSLTKNTNGSLLLQRGGGVDLETSAIVIPNINTWYYVEVKVKHHDTLGIFQVCVDGNLVINFSGDTRYAYYGSTDTVDYFNFGKILTSLYNYFDDLYICDALGTKNNDFLGDCRIDTIKPNSAGNYAQLTPSVGANYACVNEALLSETDYVDGGTGLKDSYNFEDCPAGIVGEVYGVQTNIASKRTVESATIQNKALIRTGAADYLGVAKDETDTDKIKNTVFETDPSDSSTWTKTKINACEFGIETV